MPFSWCSPASVKVKPLPATSSFTVWETSTCEGWARAAIRAPVDTDMPALSVHQLALARMHAGPHLDAEAADAFVDVQGAVDRPGRAVEGRKEAVARGVVLLS